jgi:hypothetical protein
VSRQPRRLRGARHAPAHVHLARGHPREPFPGVAQQRAAPRTGHQHHIDQPQVARQGQRGDNAATLAARHPQTNALVLHLRHVARLAIKAARPSAMSSPGSAKAASTRRRACGASPSPPARRVSPLRALADVLAERFACREL